MARGAQGAVLQPRAVTVILFDPGIVGVRLFFSFWVKIRKLKRCICVFPKTLAKFAQLGVGVFRLFITRVEKSPDWENSVIRNRPEVQLPGWSWVLWVLLTRLPRLALLTTGCSDM